MKLKLSPTQKRLMAILRDGLAHSTEELHTCINDELTGKRYAFTGRGDKRTETPRLARVRCGAILAGYGHKATLPAESYLPSLKGMNY
jgi:hypothetical protein